MFGVQGPRAPAPKFESLCKCRLLNETGSGVLAGECATLCGGWGALDGRTAQRGCLLRPPTCAVSPPAAGVCQDAWEGGATCHMVEVAEAVPASCI